jgi:hypothetical protein
MKKISLILLFSFIAALTYAQQNDYIELVRSTIKTEKKALIAEVMQLSDAESQVFWPVYNEYQEKRYAINTNLFNLITDFAENFENMSPEKATDIAMTSNKHDMDILKLEKTYFKKISKMISPQKAFRFLQAENKIEAMINAQLASEIPLLESIE